MGIALRCPSAAREPLRRSYAHVDAVVSADDRGEVAELLGSLGYQADESFNLLHGSRRLLFWDPVNSRQVDVFVDQVEICHRIDLRDRLDVHDRTLSLVDLLPLKLQVIETNRKDLIGVVTLLAGHRFTGGETGINLGYLVELASNDWGLWRTTTMMAARAGDFSRGLEGLAELTQPVEHRTHQLLFALEDSEKTRRWRWRARIGERKRWYELPEEVN